MESKWPTRQPHRSDGRGGVVPTSKEAGVALLRSLGVDSPEDQGNGISLGDDPAEASSESKLLEQAEAELAAGVVMTRLDYLQVSLPWRIDSTSLAVVEKTLLQWHSASTRLDRVFARPEPLTMTGEDQASCPLVVVRGVRCGGPLGQNGRPVGARTIPAGSEGRLIVGAIGVGELIGELRSNAFLVRAVGGSSALVLLEARPRRGSALFPAVRTYRRARGQLARLEERLARPRRRRVS